jgi:hypothetical protein
VSLASRVQLTLTEVGSAGLRLALKRGPKEKSAGS